MIPDCDHHPTAICSRCFESRRAAAVVPVTVPQWVRDLFSGEEPLVNYFGEEDDNDPAYD